jgi:hypothetical protein
MAGTSSNSRDLARRLGPAATAATKQEQRVEHLAERLSHAATAAHWRALDVIRWAAALRLRRRRLAGNCGKVQRVL